MYVSVQFAVQLGVVVVVVIGGLTTHPRGPKFYQLYTFYSQVWPK